MVNFDDMTLEELQKLLNIQTKNPDEVKSIQELAGLTGKAVDGIWGPQTSNAYNKFYKENQSDIEQAISDEQKYQNAIARGQNSPAVVDLVGYSNQRDEQRQARNSKISQLEQQIAFVKERIARNERTLTGKSYDDVNNKLAALEMKKINSQDPTTLWRWQNLRQDTMNANAAVSSNAAEQFKHKVNMWNRTKPSNTTEGIEQQISNINAAILEGDNIGADVSELYVKMQELQKLLPGGTETEQKAGELDTALATAKTSDELIGFRNGYKWKPAQLSKLDTKIAELQKNEAAKSNAAAKKKSRKSIFGD